MPSTAILVQATNRPVHAKRRMVPRQAILDRRRENRRSSAPSLLRFEEDIVYRARAVDGVCSFTSARILILPPSGAGAEAESACRSVECKVKS
mmetsp:Transcript_36823/g.57566  ORF Transcript_36823/g.57566 Transcript_36823/m.57566 type:complete len:93 (-) Transcript_36823:142-420(-)